MARDQRRLAAIVSADVAGYSRLMGQDDSDTLARLKAHRRELIDPKIAEHDGRIVKTTGDGLLLEFPSVVDAVRCAVDIQRGMAERNAGLLPDQLIDLRIGINIGDIIIDGEDIYGDGVNVAARLQAMAEPGGICASKVVRDQVLDKLSFTFEDLGAQQVKNIARPVEVYRIDLGSEALQTPSGGRRRWLLLTRAVKWRWLGGGALALSIAGVGLWTLPRWWQTTPTPTTRPPAVAVLHFTAPDGSPAEEQLAGTLTRDLTSALGRDIRMTKLVSDDLAFSYKGKSIDARNVGRELDVSYLVTGDVRRVGERLVLSLQLIDTSSATQLWNDRVELDPARLAQNQATVPQRLNNGLVGAITDANMRRYAGPPGPHASAIELAIHANAVWYRDNNTLRGALEARKWFDQALRLDASFVPAMLGRLRTLEYELVFDAKADPVRVLKEMDELSFRAVSIENTNPSAWSWRAETLMLQRRWEAALQANAKAEKLTAFPGWDLNRRAAIMIFAGKPTEALALVEQQLALDPQQQEELGWAMLQRCRAYMALGRYDDAIAACERNVAFDNWWLPHLYLVAAYTQNGQLAKAAAEKVTLIKMRPTASIAELKKLYYSDNAEFEQQTETHLFAGLRKAGIAEN